MDLMAIISQVGFPIGVSAYLLVTVNKTLKENTEVVKANTSLLKIIINTINKKEGV